MDLELKYGCNPHQKPARLMYTGKGSPLEILNGSPSYINILDAFSAWQLAKELKAATGKAGAASFKHVSPAGAAIARKLDSHYLKSQFLEDSDYSDVTTAYIRARGGDRMCSYGDVAAVSDKVDVSLAGFLKNEVCDLIIAPDYDKEALEILKTKKKGNFLILKMDPSYEPEELEKRILYGFELVQKRNNAVITRDTFKNIITVNKAVTESQIESLIVATIALKYTQSNSICIAYDGQVIGMGAGQQSRIHCTRLACSKAEKWFLQQQPKITGIAFSSELKKFEKTNVIDQILLFDELSENEKKNLMKDLVRKPEPFTNEERKQVFSSYRDICMSSDAFIPFRDNIDRASRTHIGCIAHSGEAIRDEDVTKAADEYHMIMMHTGVRLFTH